MVEQDRGVPWLRQSRRVTTFSIRPKARAPRERFGSMKRTQDEIGSPWVSATR